MNYELITDINEIPRIKVIWDHLMGLNDTYAPFYSYEWILRWWKYFGNDSRLNLVLVREDDDAIGIAPFMISKKQSGIKRLEFIIDENGSRFDFIVTPECREIFFHSLSAYLYNNRDIWDELFLNYFPCSSKNYESFKNTFTRDHYFIGENYFYSPYIRLETDWENFLKTLSKKFRANLNADIRKVESQNIVCRMISREDDIKKVIEDVFDVEKKTWKQIQGTSLTADEQFVAFYRDIISDAWEKGSLYLGMMERNNDPVAYDFNWIFRNTVYSLKMGYDEEFKKLGPGKVLFAYTIKKSFEDGYKYHELMGVNEGFKGDWTKDNRKHSRLHIYHSGLKSRLCYYYNFKIKNAAKSLLKR